MNVGTLADKYFVSQALFSGRVY